MSRERPSSSRRKRRRDDDDDDDYDCYAYDDDHYNDKSKYDDDYDYPSEDYYCALCNSQMNSLLTWDTHVIGRAHKKKKAAAALDKERDSPPSFDSDLQQFKLNLAGAPSVMTTTPSVEVAMIQKKLNSLSAPIVGLSYVREIWRKTAYKEPIYRCDLCEADCQLITIIHHIIGFKHRMSYIKIKEPIEYRHFSQSSHKKSVLTGLVSEAAEKLQTKYGRGQVVVEIEIDDPKKASASVKREPSRRYETDDSADTQTEDISSASEGEYDSREKKVVDREYDSHKKKSVKNEVVAKKPKKDVMEYLRKQPLEKQLEILAQMDMLPPYSCIDEDLFRSVQQKFIESQLAAVPYGEIYEIVNKCIQCDYSGLNNLIPEFSNNDYIKRYLLPQKENTS